LFSKCFTSPLETSLMVGRMDGWMDEWSEVFPGDQPCGNRTADCPRRLNRRHIVWDAEKASLNKLLLLLHSFAWKLQFLWVGWILQWRFSPI
jgi:hypothetical protein